MTHKDVERELKKYIKPGKSTDLSRFFKTGKGDYGEGDIFIGVSVPHQRKVAKQYINLSHKEVLHLLQSPIHEHRLTALIIWTLQYEKGDKKTRQTIFKDYLKHYPRINNWDLVDVTAPKIVGHELLDKDKSILYTFAKSTYLWKKRIAIISTLEFIRHDKLEDTFKIALILLHDSHDLIHKAVGWMLREAGKKDVKKLYSFLEEHAPRMPRTMLRYAIEKFPKTKREYYMTLV